MGYKKEEEVKNIFEGKVFETDDPKNVRIEPIIGLNKELLELFIRLYEVTGDKSVIDKMVRSYSTSYMVITEDKK